MEKGGWVFNVTDSGDANDPFADDCGTSTWFGYSYGTADGSVTASFIGSGRAVLGYGNCYSDGRVVVYLNGNEVSHALSNNPKKVITFEFSHGDVLTIKETGIAIIKLNYLIIECEWGKCLQ